MRNEMVMDQLTTFHKLYKKVRSEKMMDYLIHQTKHAISFLVGTSLKIITITIVSTAYAEINKGQEK
jgi:hypothetical protein